MGTLKAICISVARGTAKYGIEKAELAVNHGIRGDAHAGRWHRQVSLLPYEAREDFKARGADIIDGSFGENLLVEGYDLKHLDIGTRFAIGDTLLEMSQIGKECHSHCQIFQTMGECIMPHEGVFAVVLKGGEIKVGDEVSMIPADMYATLRDREKDSDTVMATVVSGRHIGEKMLYMDGIIRGYEGKHIFLSAHKDEICSYEKSGIYEIDGHEVFVEKVGSKPNLVICGGGHVSAALTSAAKPLGFEITVIEDREMFAENAKLAGADHVVCGSYSEVLESMPESLDNYFVALTRGHQFDKECLEQIMRKKYAYVGMMGSRRRSQMVREYLLEKGFSDETVASLHSPVGLSIGAETPEEIAVSIAAELIKVKKEKRKTDYSDDEIIKKLSEREEQMALCTIIRKRGSAPREIGTKMLVTKDEVLGTIGGGSVEWDVICRCRENIEAGLTETLRITADMTNEEAADDGLICGGVIDVLVEFVSGASI